MSNFIHDLNIDLLMYLIGGIRCGTWKFDIWTQGLTEVGIIFKIIMYLELLSN